MAINIGPRIGIDGEKEYKQALKEIITETKNLKSEMNLLEGSFKNGASEMDKAKQRTEVLKKQQEALTQEVEKLKGATEEAAKNFGTHSTEAQTWSKKLNEAQLELQNVNKELQNNTGWAAFGRECEAASKKLENIGTTFSTVGKKLTKGLTLPILGIGTAAVNTAAEFEAEMSKVEAISGADSGEMEQLTAKAREMGEQTKFSAAEAGSAMEYMAMAGWKSEDMLAGIEGIMNLAAASGVDLGRTSDIVTDALTAFGLTAKDSGHMADVLAAASANANTNVDLMGESFKYAAPVAGAMGYSIDDTAIALGLMANSGIKASMAGTSLRTIMTNMAAPTETMSNAMQQLGIQLDNGKGEMLPFRDIMDQLRAGFGSMKISVEEYNTQMAQLDAAYEAGEISSAEYEQSQMALTEAAYGAEGAMKAQLAADLAGKRGMSALLAIVNASPDDYAKLTEAVDGSSGSAKQMSEIMQNNLQGQITILLSKLQELAISFTTTVMPTIMQVVDKLQKLVDKFNGLDEEQKKTIITIALVVAALGPVLSVVGSVISVISTVTGIVGSISTAIAGAGGLSAAIGGALTTAAPVVGVIAAIIVAITAIIAVIKNWDKISEAITQTWQKLKEGIAAAANAVKEKVVGAWESMKEKVTSIFNGLKEGVTRVWDGIKDMFQRGVQKIKDIFSFHIEFPKIKLPHFSITGKFSLSPPSIPKISVDWYRKAMDGGMILNSPTIFGAQNGHLLGGGEAGPEVVVGLGSLESIIRNAVGQATYNNTYGATTINVYGAPGQDVEELAELIEEKIAVNVRRRGAAFG